LAALRCDIAVVGDDFADLLLNEFPVTLAEAMGDIAGGLGGEAEGFAAALQAGVNALGGLRAEGFVVGGFAAGGAFIPQAAARPGEKGLGEVPVEMAVRRVAGAGNLGGINGFGAGGIIERDERLPAAAFLGAGFVPLVVYEICQGSEKKGT